jgi:hypothetical protein
VVGAAVGRVLLGLGAGVEASLGTGSAVATGWPAPTESRTTLIADQEIPTANAAATSHPPMASNPIRTRPWSSAVRTPALNRP